MNRKKTKNNNNSTKVGIIVAILVLAVGFAAITTTLVINGVIKIIPDYENFIKNVQFVDASVEPADGAVVSIADDGKSITYTSHVLKSIGETSVLKYHIKNGSQYDAVMDNLTCTPIDDTKGVIGEYVTVTSGEELDGKTVPSGTESSTEEGTVTVKMIKSYVGEPGVSNEDNEPLSVSFKCEYADIQAAEVAAGTSSSTSTSTVAGE